MSFVRKKIKCQSPRGPGKKRRTAALQDAGALSRTPFHPRGFGVRLSSAAVLVVILMAFLTPLAKATGVRVRDLAVVAGARDNQLVGYGLVAGLAGDGDKDPVYSKQTIANLLQRYGINIPPSTISSKNVAVVIVTADIPAFLKSGERLDVQVASMGDAKSL